MNIGIITDIHINSFDQPKTWAFEEFVRSLNIDLLIICGDIATASQDEIEQAFKSIRKEKPKLKVACVLGNHDYWVEDNSHTSIFDIKEFHQELFQKYDVHYLQQNKLELDNVTIYGFDGWYTTSNTGTKDPMRMPMSSGMGELTPHLFMQREEINSVDYILKDIESNPTNKTKILVTHFNLIQNKGFERMSGNVRLLKFFTSDFDYIFFGHSHQQVDQVIGKSRIINVGADYDKAPSLQLFYKEIKIPRQQ